MRLKTFWLSWWEPENAVNGVDVLGIEVWSSGMRGDTSQESLVALVVAETEAAAWRKADTYYPGAQAAERRFSQEHELGWRPGSRFVLTQPAEAKMKKAELGT